MSQFLANLLNVNHNVNNHATPSVSNNNNQSLSVNQLVNKAAPLRVENNLVII